MQIEKSHLGVEPNDTNNVANNVDTLVRKVTKERNEAGFFHRRNAVPPSGGFAFVESPRAIAKREGGKRGKVAESLRRKISIANILIAYYIIQFVREDRVGPPEF